MNQYAFLPNLPTCNESVCQNDTQMQIWFSQMMHEQFSFFTVDDISQIAYISMILLIPTISLHLIIDAPLII